MALAGMKITLADEDRERIDKLTDVLGSLAQALNEYNHPLVEVTHVEDAEVVFEPPPNSGDWSFPGDGSYFLHRYTDETTAHQHISLDEAKDCLTENGFSL